MDLGKKFKNLWNSVTGETEETPERETPSDDGFGGALEMNEFDNYEKETEKSQKVLQFPQSADSRVHKVVKIKGTDFNSKRKEAAEYFKRGHTIHLNMDEANKDTTTRVLDFLGGMAYALDGELNRVSTTVYTIVPVGDEFGGDIYGDEYNSKLRDIDDTFNF